jgi:predicted transcriptional regulator of viral defense system
MNYLDQPYYIGLLSAAALYGAAHQRPQEFFVINQLPVIRAINKKGQKINFVGRLVIHNKFLEERKTSAGYVKVSNPELTALDLLQYEKHIGRLNRAATVIDELSESIHAERFTNDVILSVPVVMLQRLGYILDRILGKVDLAEVLFKRVSKVYPVFTRRPLKAGRSVKGFQTDPKWKLIINVEIETDL